MGQNAVGQSGFTIYASVIFSEQMSEIAWICACRYKFMKIKSLSKMHWEGLVENRCGHSYRTLKLAVS